MELIGKIGIIIIILDLLWVLFYYYGTAKIYNLTEQKQYQYLGYLWIRKKHGEYLLSLPKEMIHNSYTTQYKIIPEKHFCKGKEEARLRVCFGDKYVVITEVSKEITVKNYIATSNQL